MMCEGCARSAVAYRDEVLFESPTRMSEGHVGVRFGDYNAPTVIFRVFVNGWDWTRDCVEALAGRDGFALLIDPGPLSPQPCWSCGDPRGIFKIERGEVRVEREARMLAERGRVEAR